MSNSDFDRINERRHTASIKWDSYTGNGDVIPLWVADMDFRTAPVVREAMIRRAESGVYGYSFADEDYMDSLAGWFEGRHGYSIDTSMVIPVPGVVPALSAIIKALVKPGEGVIIQPPVYNCFFSSVRNNGCRLLENPLQRIDLPDGRFTYEMDLDGLAELAARPDAKLMILCNPHNPAGRAWREEELEQVAEICRENGVRVVSDEIHCEIVMPGCEYVPYGNIDRSAVVCTSPSKAFNTAGLHTSNILCPDADTREAIDHAVNVNEVCDLTCFGVDALKASYTQEGADWVDSLCDYIWENYRFFAKTVAERLPECPVTMLEATYLPMIDVSAIEGYTSEQLEEKLKAEAGVWVNAGEMYGREGFLRVNLACPRATLAEGLDRLCKGLSALKRR
jgi:cystathionine beta-lyase